MANPKGLNLLNDRPLVVEPGLKRFKNEGIPMLGLEVGHRPLCHGMVDLPVVVGILVVVTSGLGCPQDESSLLNSLIMLGKLQLPDGGCWVGVGNALQTSSTPASMRTQEALPVFISHKSWKLHLLEDRSMKMVT